LRRKHLLSLNGKSRVSREAQARFREGLGVKLPGATRPATTTHAGRNARFRGRMTRVDLEPLMRLRYSQPRV